MKCGEEQHCCLRCITAGRLCESYETIRLAQTSTRSNGTLSLQWVRPTPLPEDHTSQDQLAFQSFQDHMLDELAGLFSDRLWSSNILLISMRKPAVRHAVVALGTLGRRRRHNRRSKITARGGEDYPLQQYGKATTALQVEIAEKGHVSPDFILFMCLLFVNSEFHQSGWEQAMAPLDSGFCMTRELRENTSSMPEPESKQIWRLS